MGGFFAPLYQDRPREGYMATAQAVIRDGPSGRWPQGKTAAGPAWGPWTNMGLADKQLATLLRSQQAKRPKRAQYSRRCLRRQRTTLPMLSMPVRPWVSVPWLQTNQFWGWTGGPAMSCNGKCRTTTFFSRLWKNTASSAKWS